MLMEWQSIVGLISSPIIILGLGYLVGAVRQLQRGIKLDRINHQALMYALGKNNGFENDYQNKRMELMKDYNFKHLGGK